MSDLIKIAGLVLLVVLIIAIGPLLTIWAFNTLFPVLAIPYTFWTWLAVIFLGVFIRSDINIKK
jgi:hypothetical protein